MKRILFLTFLLAGIVHLQAQTRLIAHKSHAGALNRYSAETLGNFGRYEPPITLKEVEKLNDTTVVLTQEQEGTVSKDTIYNHPLFSNPNISVDSLKKTYYRNEDVKFKHFDRKTPETKSRVVTPVGKQPSGKQSKERSSEKNSILLLLIGGGAFLGIGLLTTVGRNRKRMHRYA